uniref:AAA+ ATPase domain-containing protein n=1 Tax=Neobodo designis TaxID=312471 RepID=A0A7S1W306_NEODS
MSQTLRATLEDIIISFIAPAAEPVAPAARPSAKKASPKKGGKKRGGAAAASGDDAEPEQQQQAAAPAPTRAAADLSKEDAEKFASLWQLTATDAVKAAIEIDAPSDEAFANDSDFICAEEAWTSSRAWEICVSAMAMPQTATNLATTGGLNTIQAIDLITKVTAAVRKWVDSRAAAMSPPPRAHLLAARLGLSRKETAALLHIHVQHVGTSAPSAQGISLAPNSIARAVRMSSGELIEFVKDHRPHMKQGVIAISEANFKNALSETRLKMPTEVVTALCGATLTDEQLIKLEKTALCDVVRETANGAAAVPSAKLPPRAEQGSDGQPASRRFPTSDEILAEVAAGMAKAATEGASDADGDSSSDDGADDAAEKAVDAAVAAALNGNGNGNGHSFQREATSNPGSPVWNAAAQEKKASSPYEDDMTYMDDCFKWLATIIKKRNAEADVKDEDDDYYNPKNKAEATLRELKGRERVLRSTMMSRLTETKKKSWRPRAEALAERLGLTDTEKNILLLLVGNVVSHDILIAVNGRYVMRGDGQREFTVGYILFVLFGGLEDRVQGRKCFYTTSPLLKHGLVSVSAPSSTRTCFNTDLSDYMVDVDRRIVDHLMGLETEPSEMVQGSKVYTPTVPLGQVVLPDATKQAVITTIGHYSLLSSCKRKVGFGNALGEGASGGGLVLLFYGPSGTGKTMLANAVAKDLGKKVLTINVQHFRQLSTSQGSDVMRFIFREAKLSDAIIFFDECESIFEARDSNPMLTSILPEFERYDGIVILATNRAQAIDEAMNRRISLMVEFTLPDHEMRERIWRAHLPDKLKIADDVSIDTVALDYELSGGLIKNAVLAALSAAVARENSDEPTVTMDDLVHGAKTQMRGLFQAANASAFANKNQSTYITPRRRLEDVVLPAEALEQLKQIVKLAKSRHTLYAQWGFDQRDGDQQNAVVLLHGPSGTGKSLAAEAIAFECGLALRVANTAALMHAGDSQSEVQKAFEEARQMGAAVVFDEAQCLFDHNERAGQLAQQIQFFANSFTKPVLVLAQTDKGGGAATADMRMCKLRFTDELAFSLPSKALRRKLWDAFLPARVPRADGGVDFARLAAEQSVSARVIKAVCFSCCAKVALRSAEARVVSTDDLLAELREHAEMERRRAANTSMFI